MDKDKLEKQKIVEYMAWKAKKAKESEGISSDQQEFTEKGNVVNELTELKEKIEMEETLKDIEFGLVKDGK